MTKISTKELREILNDYTGGKPFNKTIREMKKYIRYNFICSEYTVEKLAREFAGK
jgi:hypothetical protein